MLNKDIRLVDTQFHSPAYLDDWLRMRGIDTSQWGSDGAKRVKDLWAELLASECVLSNEEPPRRLVKYVLLIIRQENKILIEAEQKLRDGRHRVRNRPPAEKVRPGEDYVQAILRCLHEELGVSGMQATVQHDSLRVSNEVRDSLSYPGLLTIYESWAVAVDVAGLPECAFETEEHGLLSQAAVTRHYWEWHHETDAFLETDCRS